MANMISDAGLYIDFGEDGDAAGAALKLEYVQNLKEADGRSVEVKKAMGVKGGAGVIRKNGGGTLTLSEYRHDDPQVRWRRLRKLGTFFTLSVQDEGGVRQKWFSCTVSKIDRDDDDDGNHMDSIEIVYLQSEESV